MQIFSEEIWNFHAIRLVQTSIYAWYNGLLLWRFSLTQSTTTSSQWTTDLGQEHLFVISSTGPAEVVVGEFSQFTSAIFWVVCSSFATFHQWSVMRGPLPPIVSNYQQIVEHPSSICWGCQYFHKSPLSFRSWHNLWKVSLYFTLLDLVSHPITRTI